MQPQAIGTQVDGFQSRFPVINPLLTLTSAIAEHRLMCTPGNPCFRLLGLPVEIVENIVLYLPAPAILRLRAVRDFQYQTLISVFITDSHPLS